MDNLHELTKEEIISKFNLVKRDLEAALREKDSAVKGKEAALKETVAAREKFAPVLNELKNPQAVGNAPAPLEFDSPNVMKFDDNVISKSTITNNCSFSTSIRMPPQELLDALTKDHTATDSKLLFQKTVKKSDGEIVVYWSFMLDKTKTSCDLLLRLTVEKDGDEIRIGVVSVEEVGELPDPYPNATKELRLLLKGGTILLQPLPFMQIAFTFTAIVSLGVKIDTDIVGVKKSMSAKNGINVSTSTSEGAAVNKLLFYSNDGQQANKLFCKIGTMLYERFKNEKLIDERMKQDFIENIDNAPPLTQFEHNLIGGSMKVMEEISSLAKVSGERSDEDVTPQRRASALFIHSSSPPAHFRSAALTQEVNVSSLPPPPSML